MKSLEKERSRRYDTANGLARDIERFLNEEAVEACPPSTVYRMKKFVRKHKGQMTAVPPHGLKRTGQSTTSKKSPKFRIVVDIETTSANGAASAHRVRFLRL